MPYESLDEFIKAADAVGEVRQVEGASLNMDVGCLTELMSERDGPMLVFDKFKGYPAGYRVASNGAISSPRPTSSAPMREKSSRRNGATCWRAWGRRKARRRRRDCRGAELVQEKYVAGKQHG